MTAPGAPRDAALPPPTEAAVRALAGGRASRALGTTGLVLLGVLVAVAAAAPLLAPWDPGALAGAPFQPPGPQHLLGTDDVGHDLLSALLYGARTSLIFGIAAALAATAIGTSVGVYAGFVGGAADAVLMRLTDVILVLPFLPLLLVVGAYLGPGIATEIAVVSAVMWARPARELRAQVLSFRQRGHVQAAVAMGASRRHVLGRHLLPGILPILVPHFIEAARAAILVEASLSFLGLGDPTVTSWGTILYHANARGAFLSSAWPWWVVPPGLCIGITVLAFALAGYAVEERSRPRLPTVRRVRPTRSAAAPEPAPADDAARLDIRGLTVEYHTPAGAITAAESADLRVGAGEIVGLVGESGSGKSTLAAAALGLLPASADVAGGSVHVSGHAVHGRDDDGVRRLRGRAVALVPQSALNALDPVMRAGEQIAESIGVHQRLSPAQTRARTLELLAQVELAPAAARAFPHELSGGMRQRVVIACALANDPALLIADEPTSGLDTIAQERLLRLLRRLCDRLGFGVLLITHDIGAALGVADRIAVMHAGRIVEDGAAPTVASAPAHPYTRRLLAAVPRLDAGAATDGPPPARDPLLRIDGVYKSYRAGARRHVVLHDVSLRVGPGEVLGLVGASGAGKTTVARLIFGLEPADAGRITVQGTELSRLGRRARGRLHAAMHLVLQDPYDALPPHRRVRDIVAEPVRIHGGWRSAGTDERVRTALAEVALNPPEAFANRFPHELSGGERQRVALARAIVLRPRLIVADEPTSLLDAPLRVELLALVRRLGREHDAAVLYITHDLALARAYCDRIAVLAEGAIVEEGAAADVIERPRHARTVALVRAAQAASATSTSAMRPISRTAGDDAS